MLPEGQKMNAESSQIATGACTMAVPATTPPQRHDKIVTIEDAKKRYRESRDDDTGYRALVTLLIDSGFSRPFQNDSYYDALVLTEAMFERTNRDIRWLTGSGTDGFVCELQDAFVATLKRVQSVGGTVKLIMLSDQKPKLICDLMTQFPKTLQVALAKPLFKLQHFIVCDSKIVRAESPHQELTNASSAHEIKAEVFFNNPERASMLSTFFDAIWTSVQPVNAVK
jgi:hypothetical protein